MTVSNERLAEMLGTLDEYSGRYTQPQDIAEQRSILSELLASRTAQEPVATGAAHIIASYGRDTPLDAMAMILFEAWCKAEPTGDIAKYPASYMASFVDMARAVLASPPSAQGEPVADRWRNLALQFDGHRINAMSLLRGVVAGSVGIEAIAAFLAAPPLSGEAVLAERIAALSPAPSLAVSDAWLRQARDYIEEMPRLRPEDAHPNDRDQQRELEAQREPLIAALNAALAARPEALK